MADQTIELMNRSRIERALKRMAYQIVENAKGNSPILLVGIDRRGYAVAKELSQYLSDILDENISPLQLTINGTPQSNALKPFKQMEDAFLVLVDDVIFTGHTMFKALQQIAQVSTPQEAHIAVLVDRGHRKLPFLAEYIGIQIPTKQNEHVQVDVDDSGIIKQVLLIKE